MKSIDMRFDPKVLENLIGKTFTKYRCDAFDYTNSVTQIVALYVGGEVYTLTNIQESTDYFGNKDDVAIFRFQNAKESEIKSAFMDVEMINTPVNCRIEKIHLINENQKISEDDRIMYDVWLTRGIIIFAGGREISFEKDSVPFSEEILIQKGYNLIRTYADEKEFLLSWPETIEPECFREVVEIK